MGLDFKSIPMELVINIANIVVLFVLLRLLVYKPVKKFMDGRSARVEQQINDAQALHDQAQAQQDDLGKILQAQREQHELGLRERDHQAMEQGERIIDNATQRAEQIVLDARHQAEQEHEQALMNLKDEVSGLSVNIARKIIGRELTQGDNAALVDEFFNEVK